MTQPAPTTSATFWAQVEATWHPWYNTLRSVHVAKITQRKPGKPQPGTVLVKLTITLPRHAFVPPELEGTINVPDGKYEVVPATVEAGDL